MSCDESSSTDSGVEKPAIVSVRVAPGAARGDGGGAGALSTACAVSATFEIGRLRSTGWQAAATARVVQRTVDLIKALPPRPGPRCVARRARGSPRRYGRRAVSNSAVGTYPRRTPCALRDACGRPAEA